MSFWSFYISKNEIKAAALDLIERHGEDAHEEAIRLAEVGRRLGSKRNSAILRRAARYIAREQRITAKRVPKRETRLGKIADLLSQFGSPRVADETEVCE
jgi:hypothetical protein